MRFQALDSWRGVAALVVVAYHCAFVGPLGLQGLGFCGYLWVDFFFVLSGFVIAHAYGERLSTARQVGGFMLRRFGRLWPLHLTTLLVFVALRALMTHFLGDIGQSDAGAPSPNDETVTTFVANLLLFNAMGVGHGLGWNTPSWSIGAEFWTYVVFFLVALCTRPLRLPLSAAIAGLGATMILLHSTHVPLMDATYDLGFLRCLYGFFVGVLTYAGFRKLRDSAGVLRAATAAEIAATAAALAFVAFAGEGVFSLAAPLVFALVVFVFAHEGGAISRLLRRRVFVKLGAWSYSIYMLHVLVSNAVVRAVKVAVHSLGLPPLQTIDFLGRPLLAPQGALESLVVLGGEVAVILAVVAVSSLTFAWIEVPARRAFNRLAARLESLDVAEPAAGVSEAAAPGDAVVARLHRRAA